MSNRSFTFEHGVFEVKTGDDGSVTVNCAHPSSTGARLVIQADGTDYTLPAGNQSSTVYGGSGAVTMTGTLPTCTTSFSGFQLVATGKIEVISNAASSCGGTGDVVIYFTGSINFSDTAIPVTADHFRIFSTPSGATPWKL